MYSIWLAFPPLLALVISFWLLANSDKRSLITRNSFLSVFLLSIVGLNFIELLTYTALLVPNIFLMKLYYIFLILTLVSVLALTTKICNINILAVNHSKIVKTLCAIAFLYCTLLLSTNLIISDISFTSYSVTRVPGEYYFLIKLLFVGLSLPILALLIIGSTRKNLDNNVKRSRLILFSFSPLLISLLVVLGLMELGFAINATVVLPIGTTILLVTLINTERKQDLFKFLIKIPYTAENISYKKITAEIEGFLTSTQSGQQNSLKDLTSNLEQHIVNLAVEISNGSQVKAAALLNTSTSSICRKKKG